MFTDSLTVYYQKGCIFCESCRVFIEKRCKPNTIIFKDIESNKFDIFSSDVKNSEVLESIKVVEKEVVYSKFMACLKISSKMNTPWPLIGRLLSIFPNFFGDFFYDLIGNNRKAINKVLRLF